MDRFVRDVRYAVRRLAREPRFAAAVLATLALCLGANLTIFAIADAVLLRPLPFPDADRLVTIYNTYPNAGVLRDGASVTNYYERRGRLSAFSSLAIFRPGTAVAGEARETASEPVMRVSSEFFSTLGVALAKGRTFTDDEMTRQADSVVILTDASWKRRFAADPAVLGRTIRIDGASKVIVGILPADFQFLSSDARMYLPLSSSPVERAAARRHSGTSTEMVARLAPGVSIEEAQTQLDAQNASLERSDPDAQAMADAGFRSIVTSLRGDHVASIRPFILLTQAGVLSLLLIGAVNVVNLLLIRAAGRTRDLAIRRSLGASTGRLIREIAAEAMLLSAAGGLLSLGVAIAGVRSLTALGTDQLPLGSRIAIDGRMAFAAFAGSIVVGGVIAAPAAWFHLRADPADALRAVSRGGTAGRGTQRARDAFVIAQIALAFVLLAGAALLTLSVQRAMQRSPGFRADHLLTAHVALPAASYRSGAARLGFADRAIDLLSRQPGVSAAAAASNVPLSSRRIKSAVTVIGHVSAPGESPQGYFAYGVEGDYFGALGIPLREGRYLTAADSQRTEPTCVVDEEFARRYWPAGRAIGRQLFEGSEPGGAAHACTVVGVVGPVKQIAVTDEHPQGAVYFPLGHRPDGTLYIVARTRLPPAALAAILPGVVRQIDPELPVDDLQTMDARIADSLVGRRSPAVLTGIFAAMALLLAALGTYGVLSYAVAQRRREIGVRIALGAQAHQIRGQFLAVGLRLLAIGSLLGLLGAAIAGRALRSVLFDVPPVHPATLAVTAFVISAVTLAACVLPARRAAQLSPMDALEEQ